MITEKAKAALIDKRLNQKGRYLEGVMTAKEWLEIKKKEGCLAKQVMKSKTRFNRTKFNRMDNDEQKEYEKRIANKVTCYELHLPKGSFFDLTKTEFDYFNSLP